MPKATQPVRVGLGFKLREFKKKKTKPRESRCRVLDLESMIINT